MLDEQMESAFIEGHVKSPDLEKVVLDEQKENTDTSTENVEEDVEMLRQLIRDMDTSKQAGKGKQKGRHGQSETSQQIAASHEEQSTEQPEVADFKDSEESEIDLLEEFVQSFLA